MYDLVMNIEEYPYFLPWCKQVRIKNKISEQNLQAELLINFKNFLEKYTSDVRSGILGDDYFVDVVAIDGPFKILVNKWRFRGRENGGCDVDFFIEFEFSSIFLTKLLGAVFESVTKKIMAAFEDRARKTYKHLRHC